MHRATLNPIEEAHHIRRIIEVSHVTQTASGERMGRSQEWVANHLRLTEAKPEVQALIISREIRHALILAQWDFTSHFPVIMERLKHELATEGGCSIKRLEKIIKEVTEPAANRKAEEAIPAPENSRAPASEGSCEVTLKHDAEAISELANLSDIKHEVKSTEASAPTESIIPKALTNDQATIGAEVDNEIGTSSDLKHDTCHPEISADPSPTMPLHLVE